MVLNLLMSLPMRKIEEYKSCEIAPEAFARIIRIKTIILG